jgi:uncharacterized coiled-coil protein SlyX
MEQKTLLEAEMGRTFIELEKAKAAQAQLAQKINAIVAELEKLKEKDAA